MTFDRATLNIPWPELYCCEHDALLNQYMHYRRWYQFIFPKIYCIRVTLGKNNLIPTSVVHVWVYLCTVLTAVEL